MAADGVRVAAAHRAPADPQLNVVLAALGVAFILGAAINSGSGQGPGLLFIVGVPLGLVLFRRRSGRAGAWRLVPAGVVIVAVEQSSGAWTTAATALGIAVGLVLALACAGRLRLTWLRPA